MREEALRRREALSLGEREAKSRLIRDRLLAMPEMARARVIHLYVAVKSEVRTEGLIRDCLSRGKQVVVPWMERSGKGIVLSRIEDMDRDLQAGLHGIPEPHPESLRPVPLEEVDLMVLPLAAFDPAGNRLGYGRGYYDRLLGSATTRPLLIGAAFEIQCVDAIPHEPHDVRLDWIVTEERGLNFYGSL